MRQPPAGTAPSGGESTQPRFDRRWLALDVVGVILLLLGYGFSFFQVSAYEAGIARDTFTVSGAIPVPVIYLHPSARRGDAIAIIVHGYSGSKELMIGFGVELARMGVPSYLLDLPGHGESTVPLRASPGAEDDSRTAQLEQALGEVVAYARAHSDVAQPKLILLGHSLGTLVVGDYALNQPETALAATILVSPVLQDKPTLTHPANLLVIVGEDDIPAIITTSPKIIGAGCGALLRAGAQRYDCGDVSQGTGRRLVEIPGANHITILTDAATFRAVDSWVGATDAIPTVPVESDTRLHWAELGVAFAFLALFPLIGVLARLLTRRGGLAPETIPQGAPEAEGRAGRWSLLISAGIFALGVALSVLFLRAWAAAADALQLPSLRSPFSWVGITLADYNASFALTLALIVAGLLYAFRRRLPLPAFRDVPVWRQVALGAIIFLVLYTTVGALTTYAWQRFLLDGPRLLRGIPLALAGAPLFLLIEGLVAAEGRGHLWRGSLIRLGAYLLICAGVIGAIMLDPALGFLSLLAPIEALLFVAIAALAWQINRQGQRFSLSVALIATLIIGWALAAVFPIAG